MVALLLQLGVRTAWQIRSLPERVMESLLVLVPLDLFERGLAQFGAQAKELALTGTLIGMALVLIVIGVLALDARWRGWQRIGLGLVLWLLTMGVLMPVTGAGVFASGLLISPVLTSTAYLLVFLGYAVVLTAGGAVPASPRTALADPAERRALVAGVVGALAAAGLAAFVGRRGGVVVST
jgi:uncharacterized membrane protein (DUF441 family)